MPVAAGGTAPAPVAPLGRAWNGNSSARHRDSHGLWEWPRYSTPWYLCSEFDCSFYLICLLCRHDSSQCGLVYEAAQAGIFSDFSFLPQLSFSHVIHAAFSVFICFACSIFSFLQIIFGRESEKGDARVQHGNCSELQFTPRAFTGM